MKARVIRLAAAGGICLAMSSFTGCKVAQWFSSKPAAGRDPVASVPLPNAGYLAAGPTFTNVQASYEPHETAVERALRLEADNEKLRQAIIDRDQRLQQLQQRVESKERLLRQIETELDQSIDDVSEASRQLELWNNDLKELHAKTRKETDANARALDTLSQRVEALLEHPGPRKPLPVGGATDGDEQSDSPRAPEPVFELPEPLR